MQIVVDESLGVTTIPDQWSRVIHLRMKPMKLRNGQEWGEEEREAGNPIKPRPRPYTLSEEISYFSSVRSIPEGIYDDIILYFFDSTYTNLEILRRIRNWLYPDIRLIPVSVGINRAEIYYLIYHLFQKVIKDSHNQNHYSDIMTYAQQLKENISSWLVMPTHKPLADYKRITKGYRPKPLKKFKLFSKQSSGKMKSIQAGTVQQVLHTLMDQTLDQQMWVVYKGMTLNLPGKQFVYELPNESLPTHIPYLHVVQATPLRS